MISAGRFVETARDCGFTFYTGVPCSYLTPFINYVINDNHLAYISSANEGDAVATAAGAGAGGKRAIAMMQNSGLGNAVSPLTSLTCIFDIPVLLVVTHRGKPGQKDEPQHEFMGKITTGLLEQMEIPWAAFPDNEEDVKPTLERANEYLQRRRKPYGLIMSKGTVAPHPLQSESVPLRRHREPEYRPVHEAGAPASVTRRQALELIIEKTPVDRAVVIATTGYTGRELFAMNDRHNQLYMVGSMGCASSFALGVSLARPETRVVIIDGDGAALMRMGNMATIGSYGPDNLFHILLDNGVHESTGAQATVSSNVDFAGIAAACGYGFSISGNALEVISELFAHKAMGKDGGKDTGKDTRGDIKGARFAHLKITPGAPDDLPRPNITPKAALQRLTSHFNWRT